MTKKLLPIVHEQIDSKQKDCSIDQDGIYNKKRNYILMKFLGFINKWISNQSEQFGV